MVVSKGMVGAKGWPVLTEALHRQLGSKEILPLKGCAAQLVCV
jgi:hypothetical protein